MSDELATPLEGSLAGLNISDLLTALANSSIAPINLINNIGTEETVDEFWVSNPNDQLVVGEDAQADFATSYGGVPTDITYHGTGTMSFLDISLLGLVTITVNPVDNVGLFSADADGQAFFLTEAPLDAANLTASASVLGVDLVDLNLNDLVTAVNTTLGGLGSITVNDILNALEFSYDMTTDPYQLTHSMFCFAQGTLIEGAAGFVAVEELKIGDLVMTRDNGLQPIAWIGSSKLTAARLAIDPKLRPIRIKAGALGEGMPTADLLVSPQHRVLVRSKIAQRMFGTNEVLVAAKQLLQLDGFDIAEDLAEVVYFHLMFDQHEIVNSNGAATESLYTGPEALKSVGASARREILSLFPALRDKSYVTPSARPLTSGRMARKLAVRHLQNHRALFN